MAINSRKTDKCSDSDLMSRAGNLGFFNKSSYRVIQSKALLPLFAQSSYCHLAGFDLLAPDSDDYGYLGQ